MRGLVVLKYKGYVGEVEIDYDSGKLHGRLEGIKDVVTFQGETIKEFKKAFEESVDDYLEFCKDLGEKPDKPFSGKLPFRTTPELHEAIFIAAKLSGKSMNSWMEEVLDKAVSEQRFV